MIRPKQFLLGALAYTLVTFSLAYVWHLVVFAAVYDRLNAFTREPPLVSLGFFAIVLQGFLLSYVYPYVARAGRPAREGLRFGLIAGLFLWSSQVVAAAAKQELTSLNMWFGIETMYFAIQFLLAGVLIGVIHGRPAAQATTEAAAY